MSACRYLKIILINAHTESLQRHFAKYGEVTDAVIMVDPITAKPRGFGFVTFKDPSLVESVCKEKHTLDSKTVRA